MEPLFLEWFSLQSFGNTELGNVELLGKRMRSTITLSNIVIPLYIFLLGLSKGNPRNFGLRFFFVQQQFASP